MAKNGSMRSAFVPHDRVHPERGEASMTRQEFAEECDINALMARYEKFGVWPYPVQGAVPQYLDLSGVPDNLMDVMNVVLQAESAFLSLPAVVRRDFDNDALKFVAFASDPTNVDKMREYGLMAPIEPEAPPMRVQVVASGSAPPQDAPGAPPGAPKA